MRPLTVLVALSLFAGVVRADVPVCAYIVCSDDGAHMATQPDAPAEMVSKLNLAFSQVAIDFSLTHVGVITNSNWMSIWRTVAHEVGHICGLRDIYDSHDGTELRVTGGSNYARMPSDYGRPDFSVPHAQRLKRMLMYGYRSDTKLAITGGDIYGLGRILRIDPVASSPEWGWGLFNVEVGFWEHGTRTPSCD